jgi:hypothetical protein
MIPPLALRRLGYLYCFISLLAAPLFAAHAVADPSLIAYSDIPGAEQSEHYELSVRTAQPNSQWQQAFALITRCKPGEPEQNAYFPALSNWSNTYINFEMSAPVEVTIRKANGEPIQEAIVRPAAKVSSSTIRDGIVYLSINEPGLFAVDIDGQMETQDTGKGYNGPPIHTLTIFANPMVDERPDPDAPEVYTVRPGEAAPSEGDWKTLYFLPGVHDIGLGFRLRSGKNYYLPGDAIVHGTMNNGGDWSSGNNIRIFGYGTLSGERIPHPKYMDVKPDRHHHHTPIEIHGAADVSVEGITLADSAYHSLMLIHEYDPEHPTDIRWLKIFTWRQNGDGINPFDNGLVEDCFIRTQDDCIYVNGRGIRRTVFWNDYNGSTFVLSALPDRELIVEDCDVIYTRAGWHQWSGGRLFNMRGEGGGSAGNGVIFRNIRASDPRPTLQHFLIAMEGLSPYLNSYQSARRPGDLSGILFQNIEIAAASVLGEPEILWGSSEAGIRDVTFENVSIGGERIRDLSYFKHNEFVTDIHFK